MHAEMPRCHIILPLASINSTRLDVCAVVTNSISPCLCRGWECFVDRVPVICDPDSFQNITVNLFRYAVEVSLDACACSAARSRPSPLRLLSARY